MNDVFLIIAGISGMLIALAHGYIGETKILRPAAHIPPIHRRVLRAVFQLSTLYWFVGGAVLVMLPFHADPISRTLAVGVVGFLYATGAAANFWATRGRHFGWPLLAATTVLAILGA